MNHRLVGYHEGTSFLHRPSGASKLLFLLLYLLRPCWSYDTRLPSRNWCGRLAFILYSWYSISGYFICACICFCFALLNVVIVYLFAPSME